MIYITDIDGKTLSKSQNLRGLRAFAGKHTAIVSVYTRTDGGADVTFRFFAPRGAYAQVSWASFVVLCEALKRWRSLYGADLFVDGVSAGTVSFTNETINKHARF